MDNEIVCVGCSSPELFDFILGPYCSDCYLIKDSFNDDPANPLYEEWLARKK
jgi:hypothetical protein